MKITKRQLKRIINEALPSHLQKHFRPDGSSVHEPQWEDVTPAGYGPVGDPSHDEIVTYLTDRARSYHADPALSSDGTEAIKSLLHDDFMDDLGHVAAIDDYTGLIDELSKSPIRENRVKITKRQLRRIIHESLLSEGARVGGLEKRDGKWIFYQKQRFARSAELEPVPLAPVLNHFGATISPSDEVDLYYYRQPGGDPADYGNYHVNMENARNGLKSFTYKPDIGMKRISLHDLKLSGRTTRIIMFVPKKRHDEPGTILE